MKRTIALFLSALLLLTACSSGDRVISSRGTVQPPSSASAQTPPAVYPPEFPPADASLPYESSDADRPTSKAPASSAPTSKAPASSAPTSKAPASSAPTSKAPASSVPTSKAPASSVPTSKAPASSAPTSKAPASSAPTSKAPAPISKAPEAEPPKSSQTVAAIQRPDEVSAVWISYLEFLSLAKNQTQASFAKNIDAVFSNASAYGLNTVMVQVRPFGDALYPSELFPWSYVLTGTEGKNPGYDPLAVMVQKAKEHHLRIEAWLNPYRVRAEGSTRALASDNPAVCYLNDGSGAAIQYKGGVYYNPASKDARDLITAGVTEIIQNYDIDGIHFDDYFYPTTDVAFDSSFYTAYCRSGGTLSQADWRRENVSKLVRQVYAAVKAADSSVLFGISPQARVEIDYNGQYADVAKWIATPGYLDYICPQIYFGFDHATAPYEEILDTWNRMAAGSGVDLYVGLAVYKCGAADTGAGTGKNEWIANEDLLARMVTEARKRAGYAGFVLYRYDSLFAPQAAVKGQVARERDNLAAVL